MRALRASLAAIGRGRVAILSIALAYAISVVIGIAMVSSGNAFALERRDAIVGDAQTSATLVADRAGDHLRAAVLDFAANLVLGGGTSTVLGVGVVLAYPVVVYRGWVGGIVSVDAKHASRLGDPGRAFYYLVTLVLQLIPYSIAGGMGIYLGLGSWRAMRHPVDSWLGLPKDRLRDVALAYVVVVPLFLVASLFEFLA
ncbi:MAG TPA: hypothetical protein VI814_06185 [Candidatus Limnocylindria bacterium]